MKRNTKTWALFWVVLVLTAISISYRLISGFGHGHSSLMFIGIPAGLAILLLFSAPAKSPSGRVFGGVTFFLLLVGILLWEGLICILMAAPIFYLVAFVVLAVWRFGRDRTKLRCVVLFPVAIMSIEGINEHLSFDRANVVEITRELAISEHELLARLSSAPRFELELPTFFKAGFPQPITASVAGDFVVGSEAEYLVTFTGPKHLDNELKIKGRRVSENEITFDFVDDSTKIGGWLTWQKASLKWLERGDQIELKFTAEYRRNLDPYWYFKPIQKYAVRLSSNHLLDAWGYESD